MRVGTLVAALTVALVVAGCGGGKKKPASRTGTPAPSVAVAGSPAAATVASTPALVPTVASTPSAPRAPFTPLPSTPIRAVTPAPAAQATPGVHTENGLQIQDVQFRGRVAASGGLRIRDKPDTSGNVVGSVPEGAMVDVEGKVLNGGEAESGKGTVWYIVGANRYVYGAQGYVESVGTPAAR